MPLPSSSLFSRFYLPSLQCFDDFIHCKIYNAKLMPGPKGMLWQGGGRSTKYGDMQWVFSTKWDLSPEHLVISCRMEKLPVESLGLQGVRVWSAAIKGMTHKHFLTSECILHHCITSITSIDMIWHQGLAYNLGRMSIGSCDFGLGNWTEGRWNF